MCYSTEPRDIYMKSIYIYIYIYIKDIGFYHLLNILVKTYTANTVKIFFTVLKDLE